MANQEAIQQIKQSLNIVDIISETVQLKKVGARHRGLSPFKQERTPSFYVDPNTQLFYCFSTNQGGDLVDFVMLTQAKTFPEALAWLAERAGIRLDSQPKNPEQAEREKREQEERKLYLKLNRFAAHFFQNQFNGEAGAEARAYADRRGLQKTTIEAYAIGYAPDSWTALRDYLLSVQAPLKKAVDLGLLRARNEEAPREDGANLYDVFRQRLIFPIRDGEGEIVGFGGRWLGAANAEAAKYMNSPESPIYNKGRMLFNLDRARKPIREKDCVVLVEGYMDCIALDQAGIHYGVATLGTALTPHHVQLLKRLSPKIVCLYDSDQAGQRATERNMELFLEEQGYPLLGAQLPEGKDPDDFLRSRGEKGKEELESIVENAPALIDLWSAKRIENSNRTLQGRTETLTKIAQKLALLRDELWIKARIPELAEKLAMDKELVMEAIFRLRKRPAGSAGAGAQLAKSLPKPSNNPPQKIAQSPEKTKKNSLHGAKKDFGFDRRFLSDAIRYPDWLPALRDLQQNSADNFLSLFADAWARDSLVKLLLPLRPPENDEKRIESFLAEVREQADLRNFVAEAFLQRTSENSPEGLLRDALARLQREALLRKRDEISQALRVAENQGELAASEKLQFELSEIMRKLKSK